ncbi:MAG: DUF192 domain-containing protein [Bdellovibrionota bacterium]
MSRVTIRILVNNKVFLKNAWKALSLGSKMKGLLGTKELKEGEGLLIPDCKQVHTYFMQYPIDVVFLDSKNKVIKLQTLKPWKISPWIYKAKSVLELPAGYAKKNKLVSGDQLEVISNDPA